MIRKKPLLFAALFFAAFGPASFARSNQAAGTAPDSKPNAKPGAATDAAAADSLETRVEKYLRNLYAWGSDYELKIGTPRPSPIADLLEVPVTVSKDGQSDSASVYVTKSGRYMFRGELTDMTVDPFAEDAAKLHVGNSPTLGAADAKVTLYEFADFECPACRQLDIILRDLLPKHPEARLVFKQFPLTEIHPWAMTAALATQCAYQQNPAAFWKMHDAIYDAQDTITADNAWDKLLDLATGAGLNADTYKACLVDPQTTAQVKSTIEEGHALNITATPTTFVNNRRVVGPNNEQLLRYIIHNIAYQN